MNKINRFLTILRFSVKSYTIVQREVLEDGDFSHFYYESVEFKPFSLSPNSYEPANSGEEVLRHK